MSSEIIPSSTPDAKSEHTVNRTGWPAGPWDGEPDRKEWRYKGLPCLIVRNRFGALCGYVGVSPGHPWHEKPYQDIDADVHGRLTYSDSCAEGGPICHVPLPGEPDTVWWLGFDCAHYQDVSPGFRHVSLGGEVYRDIAYVTGEVQGLADQAIVAATDAAGKVPA